MTVIDDDVIVRGSLQANTMQVPAGSVGDAQMSAVSPIDTDKQIHQHTKTYAQLFGTASVSERKVIHVARQAGTLTEFVATLTVACIGGATLAVDLYKNGATILSAVPTINNTHAAFAKVLGTFSAVAYVAGDVFEVKVTATTGGGTQGQGVAAHLVVDEGAD